MVTEDLTGIISHCTRTPLFNGESNWCYLRHSQIDNISKIAYKHVSGKSSGLKTQKGDEIGIGILPDDSVQNSTHRMAKTNSPDYMPYEK